MSFRSALLNRLGPGILAGIDGAKWHQHLKANGLSRHIGMQFQWRYKSIMMHSLLSAAYRKREAREYAAAIEQTEFRDPIFVLGHWRSGTTHLHNLLAVDPQFAFPTTYETVFPYTFLLTEQKRSGLLSRVMPSTRPMDNVKLSLQAPNEDEFALNTMTFLSPYMSWVFPQHTDRYDKYLTFRGVSETEIDVWRGALLFFARKLTYLHQRPIIFKSPTHTGRIKLLSELFPNCRFVHIHRDPYAVFQSTLHTNSKLIEMTSLQDAAGVDLSGRVIQNFLTMYDSYFEERPLVPASRFHEVRYEDLDQDPVSEIRKLYGALSLQGFEIIKPALEAYIGSVGKYEKNRFAPMRDAQRKNIRSAWGREFDAWKYPE